MTDVPLDQLGPISARKKYLPDLPAAIEQVLHQTKPEIPLQSASKHPTISFFLPYEASQGGRQGYPEIE